MEEIFESQAIPTASLFQGRLHTFTKKSKIKPLPRNLERMKYFFENAQKRWDAEKYGELTPARLARKFKGLSSFDLDAFKNMLERRCDELGWVPGGEEWSKFFWRSLKPENVHRTSKFTNGGVKSKRS